MIFFNANLKYFIINVLLFFNWKETSCNTCTLMSSTFYCILMFPPAIGIYIHCSSSLDLIGLHTSGAHLQFQYMNLYFLNSIFKIMFLWLFLYVWEFEDVQIHCLSWMSFDESWTYNKTVSWVCRNDVMAFCFMLTVNFIDLSFLIFNRQNILACTAYKTLFIVLGMAGLGFSMD